MDSLGPLLERIAAALERLAPPAPGADRALGLDRSDRFVWRGNAAGLIPVTGERESPPLDLLLGVEDQAEALLANTRRFAAGLRANNALLWGARGTGKSALVKAVHTQVCAEGAPVALIEVASEALAETPALMAALAHSNVRCIVFLDDLSLSPDDALLRALKPALDGGLTGAAQTIVYATSNRRQLVTGPPPDGGAHDPARADALQERLALADRFGLWLAFHPMDQTQYLDIVARYAARFALPTAPDVLRMQALQWSQARGARSGRTAWQFIVDQAGAAGIALRFDG
jgi:hypothetical protein